MQRSEWFTSSFYFILLQTNKLSSGEIAGIVVACVVAAILLTVILIMVIKIKKHKAQRGRNI